MTGSAVVDSRSPLELAEKGLFNDAAEAIDRLVDAPMNLRVLRAELDAHINSQASARERAESLLTHANLTPTQKADCWTVVGRAALKSGHIKHGLGTLRRALEFATATQDPVVEARLREQLVTSLLHWVGVESASVEMPKLRRLAVRSADARSLTAFHILAGAINARRGHFPSALSHLDAGRGLLKEFENEWLRGRLAVVASGVSLLQSDYASALHHAEEAQANARRCGSRELLVWALGNLATLAVAQGLFTRARECLSESLVEIQQNGNVSTELNVRICAIDLALAEGNLSAARDAAATAARVASSAEGHCLYDLYFLLAQVRLLYAEGDFQRGLDVAITALPQMQRSADISLSRRMRLLAAEGLGQVGRPMEGASLICDVLGEKPDCAIEIVAETFRVAGSLVANSDSRLATNHFSEALTLLSRTGNAAAIEELRRNDLGSDGWGPVVNSSSDPIIEQADFLQQSDRVVAFLQFGANPVFVGKELLWRAAESGAFLAAKFVSTNSDGKAHTIDSYQSSESQGDIPNVKPRLIPLGTLGQRLYALELTPRCTLSAMSTVMSVQRLAQTAIALGAAHQLEQESAALWPVELPEEQLGLICTSERMKDLLQIIRQVADSNVPVLISGETGVGKELFAKALHFSSLRANRTLLPFNCSTVPREVLDSQLFGHKRGSFTGAVCDSEGVIRSAAGGTLFLDEIGEMPLESQPKLLRFLESGEVLPLGDTRPLHVDVRVVAATNTSLDRLVANGGFREDLFYRLNVVRLDIPPLRERREEIPALVEHFLERACRELRKPRLRIADETLEYLVLYRWPGNVRQLANEVRRLVAMAEPGAVIMPAHLSNDVFESRRTLPTERPARLFDEVVTRIDQPLSAVLEHVERAAIQRALAVTDGHLDEAARILGLSRKGLYLKRQRLNLG